MLCTDVVSPQTMLCTNVVYKQLEFPNLSVYDSVKSPSKWNDRHLKSLDVEDVSS